MRRGRGGRSSHDRGVECVRWQGGIEPDIGGQICEDKEPDEDSAMSEEKRIDRLEGLYMENKATIGYHERMIAEMKANGEKFVSEVSAIRGEFSDLRGEFSDLRGEFSNLRSEFFKLEVRLTWRIITFSSLGGAVAAILMIIFGVGGK